MKTLTKNKQYDAASLEFSGWTKGDGTGSEGYNYEDYFRDGVYLGADEHGIEPLFGEFDVLDYAASVRHAILRSISQNEIVRTEVPAEGRDEMLSYLSDQDEMDNLDSAVENDGTLDVWGEFKGGEFRIRFCEAV